MLVEKNKQEEPIKVGGISDGVEVTVTVKVDSADKKKKKKTTEGSIDQKGGLLLG